MVKKRNKTSRLEERRRLMNRWAFDVAYLLIDGYMEERKEAFRQAHLVRKLLERLGQGEVVFEYYRSDGRLRRARGTLCRGVSEAFDNYERKTPLKPTVHDDGLHFTYWDLDREQFRSFAVARVVKIKE